jgi:hypothetical protein
MLCAHTIPGLKPGTFDEFACTFGPPEGADPGGWVRFHAPRSPRRRGRGLQSGRHRRRVMSAPAGGVAVTGRP